MRLALATLALIALAACQRDRVDLKPDLPAGGAVAEPELVEVERRVYVRIPKHLTTPEPIAEGPIAQAFEVARARRAALERANAKLREIGEIQGTEVKP